MWVERIQSGLDILLGAVCWALVVLKYTGSKINYSFQCCGSERFIPDPIYTSGIPGQNSTRSSAEEKNLGQFSKNYRTFYPKNCHEALKNMALGSGIRDPGSGKNLFRIPDPGIKGTGSRIRIRNTDRIPDPQHWSDPGSATKNLGLFPKHLLLSSRNMNGMLIADPASMFSISKPRIQGSNKHRIPGTTTLIFTPFSILF